MEETIINFTPTGTVPTKQMNPCVPITTDEIVADVKKALEVGITMVHLHARDGQYGELVTAVRELDPELVICVSTTARGKRSMSLAERVRVLDSGADMGSLTLGSWNSSRSVIVNHPIEVETLAEEMIARRMKPELEVFDYGMLNYARYLMRRDLIEVPCYVNLILGNICGAQVSNLTHMVDEELPLMCLWSAGGIGKAQTDAITKSVAYGGGVRVGLEDNIWLDKDRTVLATNQELLLRARLINRDAGREIMSGKRLRSVLGL